MICLKSSALWTLLQAQNKENFKIATTKNLSISWCFPNIQVLQFLGEYLNTH